MDDASAMLLVTIIFIISVVILGAPLENAYTQSDHAIV